VGYSDAALQHEVNQLLVLAGQCAVKSKGVGDANHLDVHFAGEFLLSTLNGES
jgi:hypothetical protein